MMKNCVVFAIIGIFAVYAQMNDTLVGNLTLSSNETLSMEDNNSTIPINEPINSKQTSSLQSSGKAKDDDNSHMTNVGDSVGNAVKNAKQAVSNAAASASDTVSKAAQSASNKVSEATAAAGHEIANVTGNGSPSFTVATLVAITSLLFNSIRLF